MQPQITTAEEWRAIPGYEGIYEVSNCGRVKRVGGNHFKSEKILNPCINPVNGYSQILLCVNYKKIMHRVHRLVGKAFLGLQDGQ